MSSDTRELLRQNVAAVKELIAGEKPDQEKKEEDEQRSNVDER